MSSVFHFNILTGMRDWRQGQDVEEKVVASPVCVSGWTLTRTWGKSEINSVQHAYTAPLSNYQEFIIDVMEEQSLRTLQQVYQCAV